MRRLNVFYDNIYRLLGNLSGTLTNYYNNYTDDIESNDVKAKVFADFTTEVDSLIVQLDALKAANSFPENLELVDKFLEVYQKFIVTYGDFEIIVYDSLSAWSLIAKRFISIISSELTPEDFDIEEELTLGDFKIVDLEGTLIENNFLFFDSANFDNSIVVFSNETTKLENFLTEEIHSAHYDLLLIWLNFLNLSEDKITQFALINRAPVDLKDLKAALKLLVLVNGRTIKTLQKYSSPPYLPHFSNFDFTLKYVQFENISFILNEYNNHTFSLDKYLKLYHTIENFMYKIKICELQATKAGKPFTINDFQTLYDSYGTNEKVAITYFFTEVGKISYDGTQHFLSFWKSQWINLEVLDPSMPTKIEAFLKTIGLNYRYNNLKTHLDGNILGIIVYKFRNAIVHNKDSEVHLESVNIPEAAKFLLESFLLPNLERITFHLIINHNSLIWYDSDKLLLFET